jgi:hypothetical protein
VRPRSDGWDLERFIAVQRARDDQAEFDEANRDAVRAEQRAARIEAVEVKVTPLGQRILHKRPGFRKRRAAAKVARASRKANR